MADIADDMSDGTSCCGCGAYFLRTNGHPALCGDCFTEQRKDIRDRTIDRRDAIQKSRYPVIGEDDNG